MTDIVNVLEALEERPMFHYDLYDKSPSIGFMIHELTDLGILSSTIEQNGKDNGYHRKYYLTDVGRKLLQFRRENMEKS